MDQTRLPHGGQAWIAKHAYIDLASEILQRLNYFPTMSRQGGPRNKTGIEIVICLRQFEGIILTFAIWVLSFELYSSGQFKYLPNPHSKL